MIKKKDQTIKFFSLSQFELLHVYMQEWKKVDKNLLINAYSKK